MNFAGRSIYARQTILWGIMGFIGTLLVVMVGCSDTGTEPTDDPTPESAATSFDATRVDSIEGLEFLDKAMLENHLGGARFRLAFVHEKHLYVTGTEIYPACLDLTQGDEGLNGGYGDISSPLFSPDGSMIVYGGERYGTTGKNVSFCAILPPSLDGPIKRLTVEHPESSAGEPRWLVGGGETRIYFINAFVNTAIGIDENAAELSLDGETYYAVLSGETIQGPYETNFPGAFKGGISKDGVWVGTAYQKAALYNTQTDSLHLLGRQIQWCNASINPFNGGPNTDYLMMLSFGNINDQNDLDTGRLIISVENDTLYEMGHENIWITNAENKMVWHSKKPAGYMTWELAEWSTHPAYATALGKTRNMEDRSEFGHLFIIRLPDLTSNDESVLAESDDDDNVKVIAASLNYNRTYSHLWVEQ
ncbi:MAG: hypothetical protein GF344_01840 [Chitinivibrionales bacterium]|nr:hypothetical protein [Chitinivibrionales bacterium]MBD3355835.1 hypothetical protein [Chitinivibrionales bacterium]